MSIILKPVITEKATNDSELNNRYAFLVNTKSNKIEIKKAVQELYNVEVVSVKTMIYAPKIKSRYTKSGLQVGATNKLKKAIVEVAEGQEIDLYGNI
ncbi:50S ribosomal protein L23 [Ornithobacterium rhinotracheale]|uniref:Large ribosomal subunit protein uL23 n=1 Tax=Ornithobacterium rhinotracheale (strain ATCC 51463 / DSM 15997 / CCUG 23171 / CIP 104009 / LMG 9086) TaxID=867902 RepID=I3ZY95_ORNRL|nr:50S ribosomal protein L23 [Ornithobacterium rhinotracheale]AFL96679.1 ribosomal protein L23 [Ornithobacterium rhinotracheale DSM 15997]AIP99524.1 50S ribosomal protein L23 [Ornithobacterium rhinotracheale ORT-UMN 88]KGB66531.1 50S ribosomal protein L23 [Ornithobacterium rhinotracheale H06-030791]MBN3662538.1 50S ribosomal protein L23 [Ornithobacterium rhinotracheale]MCK0194028.1 50S ribosomal protein L23 [Ornithobacterium rhinotracheale]